MSMTAADGLLIQLAADVAQLRNDMRQAQNIVQSGAGGMEASMNKVKNVIAGFAAGLTINAFKNWIKDAIDAGDATKEFSQKTGVAAKDVAGLQLAFAQGNVGSEALSGSINKLSKNMAEGSDGFKKLGIETRNSDGTLRNVKDVLYDVADATQAMGDGAGKVAVLQEIFGKSAAALIPTLNEGSAGMKEMADMAERLGLVIDDKTAEASDKFNDTLDLLQDSSKGMARQMAAELLPTLNDIAGAMFDNTGKSDTFKIAADALGIVLKTLYTAAVIVGGYLKTLGGDIGATAAAIMAAAHGDFSGAADIMKERAKDVEQEWRDRMKNIADVWTGASAKVIEGVAGMNKAQKENTVQTKEQEAAIKDADKTYSSFKDGLIGYRDELKSQLVEGEKLTKAQKILTELTSNSTTEVQKLSSARRDELIALAKENVQYEEQAKKVDEATKAHKKLHDELVKKNETIDEEIQKQIESNAAIMGGKEASEQLEIAKLREQAATASNNAEKAKESGLNQDIIDEYTKQAEKLGELADLKEKGIHIQAAKDSAAEWKKTTDSIGDGLTDALMRGFESGKGFGQNFKDTLTNMFKTMVLQPTLKALITGNSGGKGGTSGSIMDFLSGKNGDALGGKVSGLLGQAGNWLSSKGFGGTGSFLSGNAGMIGKLAGGASNIMAGYSMGTGINSMISGGMSMGKGMDTFQKVATGVASAVFGPIGGAVAGAIGGLVNKAFGMGDKKTQASGIVGDISAADFTGQNYSDWKQKGGWFKKDKQGTDLSAISAETSDALKGSAAAMYNEVANYADALGLPGESLKKVSYHLKIQMGDDSAANEKTINEEFAKYQDLLANQFKDVLTPFQKAGETLTQTMGRLTAIKQFSETINTFGGVFSRVASLSIDAKENLLEFAGGIDAFVQKTGQFVNDYYSENEKMALQAKQLKTSLDANGINSSGLTGKDDYRKLVESQDVNTEEGRRMLSVLLDLAPTFAQVGDYLSTNKTNLDDLSKQSPQTALLTDILDSGKSTADRTKDLNDSVDKLDGTMTAVGDKIAEAIGNMSSSITGQNEEYYRRMYAGNQSAY